MPRPNKPWYRTSERRWYATVNGRQVSLGVKGRKNIKGAKKKWYQLMAEGEKKESPKGDPNVGNVIKLFLRDCERKVKPRTLRGYKHWLEPFAQKYGRLKASALKPTLAEAYSRKPEWADASRAGFLGTLGTAFRWSVSAGIISGYPLVGMKAPPKPSRGAQALISAEEHARMLALASPTFCQFLTVLHATGARPGEVAAITAENFDARAGQVRLSEHKTAHRGKSRTILLTPGVTALLTDLARRYPTGPLLRTCWGNAWCKDVIVREMATLRQRAGIPHATAYGYRHTFATDALANGVPETQVAELLGHSGTAMLHKHYAHLTARVRVLKDALGRVRPCVD